MDAMKCGSCYFSSQHAIDFLQHYKTIHPQHTIKIFVPKKTDPLKRKYDVLIYGTSMSQIGHISDNLSFDDELQFIKKVPFQTNPE